MRRGLTTLMTVAIALVSVQAMAYAPVIDPIPSPIVGNQQSASQATRYVFKDAFNLDNLVYDETPDAQLSWSYSVTGAQKYAINGVKALDLLSPTGDPVTPPADTIINKTKNTMASAADETGQDTANNTVTIRNIALFPYGGTPSADMSPGAQNWANNSQPVTFWCSDGNAVSSQTVMFYTDNTYNLNQPIGVNKLSGGSKWTKVAEQWFNGTSWRMYDQFYDKCTSRTWSDGRGLCFEVAQTGQNWGSMQSPMGFLTLTQNKIYRLRCRMNCSQLTPGKTPLWDFIIENWSNNEPTKGLNLYGMDQYYLDNENGANAVVSSAYGTEIVMYWAPAAYKTPQWNNATSGIFANNAAPGVSYAAQKDAALRFRVMDVDANATLNNHVKSGTICLQSVIIETIDEATAGNLVVGPAVVDITAPKQGVSATNTGNINHKTLTGATVAYTGSKVTVTPSVAGQSVDIVELVPCQNGFGAAGDWAQLADEWPIAWKSGKTYRYEVTLDAPNATDAAKPWDVIWMNMESPTNEMVCESYVTASKGIASPKVGAVQTYTMYYNAGNETWSSTAATHFLRWRLRFGNSNLLNWPNASDALNTGAVRVNTVKVNEVTFAK